MVEASQYIEQCQKVLNIPMKKADKPSLMYLPLDAVKGLSEQPDRNTPHGRRDAVLLSLLYDTGARVQELVDLKVCDVNLNDTVTIVLTGTPPFWLDTAITLHIYFASFVNFDYNKKGTFF